MRRFSAIRARRRFRTRRRRAAPDRTRRSCSTATSAFRRACNSTATASIEVGNVPLFFGRRPGAGVRTTRRHGDVERDVTDEAALLATPADGRSRHLQHREFDLHGRHQRHRVRAVLSRHAQVRGRGHTPTSCCRSRASPAARSSFRPGSSTLAATYTLPTNVESAYLDVYAQSQQEDEQYFNCAPTNVASETLRVSGRGPHCAKRKSQSTESRRASRPVSPVDLHGWTRSVSVVPGSGRADARIQALSRRSDAVRRATRGRKTTHARSQRRQRRRLFPSHRHAARVSKTTGRPP